MVRKFVILSMIVLPSNAVAKTFNAEPHNLTRLLEIANSGDTINLAPGVYGPISIKRRSWPTPITINAKNAQLTLSVIQSSGIIFNDASFGPAMGFAAQGYAARLVQSKHISFNRSTFRDSIRGLVIDRSQHINVNASVFSKMVVDGINIASSQKVTVTNSRCELFNTGKAHPDCIQLWSSPKGGITADILLKGNRSVGNMQGFTAFNHVRNGVDDGGFDRVIIINNYVLASYPQGIALYDCRSCIVQDNETATIPGSRWRTNVTIIRGSVRTSHNIINKK